MDDKIVLLTHPADQGDILEDYIRWHLDLGIDFILALAHDSSDNTPEVLDYFARQGKLKWFPMPFQNYATYRPADAQAQMARDEYGADWIIMTDVDEFLCPVGDSLRAILKRAETENVTSLSVPCFNMTGPLSAGKRATENLTLRIDRPSTTTVEQRVFDNLPEHYIFIQHPPKTIVRAASFAEYGPGTHEVKTAGGRSIETSEFRILHYPIRGFDKFEQKVKNVKTFFENNDHYEDWWGWHWRRWMRFNEAGRLREEYENQFVSAARAEELISQGTCSIDRTIADWIDSKKSWLSRLDKWGLLARLKRSFGLS